MIEQIEHPTLWAAIAAASAEVNNPKKNAENPHLKNSFADLKEVMATVKPVLARHGLVIVHELGGTSATTTTTTITKSKPKMDAAGQPMKTAKGDAIMDSETQTETRHSTGETTVKTVLVHAKTGEKVESTQSLRNHQPGTNDAQSAGIAITYMRRYAVLALLGIVGDADGDGSEYDWMPRETSPVIAKAEAEAAKGAEAFRAYFKSLPPADRDKITPELERLKKMAGI